MAALTPTQFVELRLELEKLLQELPRLLDLTSTSARPVDLDAPIGRLSRMDAMQNQQMAQANERAHADRLQQVKNAIAAMDGGRYGACETCNAEIPFERLEHVPETLVCVACRERQE